MTQEKELLQKSYDIVAALFQKWGIMKTFQVSVAENTKYEIIACAWECGKDWNITVCGGTQHHIGAIVVFYENAGGRNAERILLPEHRDDIVAWYFAEKMSEALHCTVCVSAGIHIDYATKEELAILVRNSKECCGKLLNKIFGKNNYSFVE